MTRLDAALVQRGLARSRGQARELIDSGRVRVSGTVVRKAARAVGEDEVVHVVGERDHYVSRAAHKLLAALEAFPVEPAGRRCIDVGASTGGFTQVLLEEGAAHVIALDVGHGQLAAEIAADPRVEERSGRTIRGLTTRDIGGPVELVVGDLSFISLRLVLAEICALLIGDGQAMLLIKPQFEVGPGRLGRRGVVTDASARREAIEAVLRRADEVGLSVLGLIRSPLRGGEGNHEYLVHLTRDRSLGMTWQAQRVCVGELVEEER